MLAFDQERGLRILEVATGEERDAEQPRFSLDHAGIVNPSVTQGLFSAGNQFLALATPTTVHVADLATGALRLSAPGHLFTFTSDGQGLLIAAPGPPEMIPLADGSYRTSGPVADGVDLVDLATLERERSTSAANRSRPWLFRPVASLSRSLAVGPSPWSGSTAPRMAMR